MTTDDSFFILRDSRSLFQRRLVDILREAGIRSAEAIQAFQDETGTAFDELVDSSEQGGFEEAEGLTASRITLMCEADLELEIGIGDISKRLSEKTGETLWKNCQLFQTLLQRPSMKLEQNPAGPVTICRGLWNLSQASEPDQEHRHRQLQRIESALHEHLPTLYTELNRLLSEKGIAPAQRTSPAIRRAPTTAGPGENNTGPNPAADMLASLQNALQQQAGSLPGPQGASGSSTGTGSTGPNVALNAANMVMLNQLVERLEALNLPAEFKLPGSAEDTPGPTPQVMKSSDLGLPQGKPEAIALDTMAYIFEALFDTPELPDAIKTILGRLQIPLLKQAILDPGLFADTEHPARQLINSIARAAVGLPRDTSREHPLVSQLTAKAAHASEQMGKSPEALATTLAELAELINDRDAAIQQAASGFIDILGVRHQQQSAERAAAAWLAETDRRAMPAPLRDFLRTHWVQAMRQAWAEDGEQGERWHASKKTFDDLLWSVQAKPEADDRKRLATLVPSLLKQIQAGFDRLGTNDDARKTFMDACFTLQTAALRGTPIPADNAPSAPPQPEGKTAAVQLKTENTGAGLLKSVHAAVPSATRQGLSRPESPALAAGIWLKFMLPDNESLYGRLCWMSHESDTALFCNPDWGYAVDISLTELEHQLQQGSAALAANTPIFDSAAERALGMIRKS